jgi:hypothetical protein
MGAAGVMEWIGDDVQPIYQDTVDRDSLGPVCQYVALRLRREES